MSSAPRFLVYGILALLCLAALQARPARAALAEEHNMLYYLMELERRQGGTCAAGGVLPALTPSEGLRRVAEHITASPDAQARLQEALESQGLRGIPSFFATVPGRTAREAADVLVRLHCASVMKPEYVFIGAAQLPGGWAVLMSAAQPREPEDVLLPPSSGAADPWSASGGPEQNARSGDARESLPGHAAPSPAPRPGVTPLVEDGAPVVVPRRPPTDGPPSSADNAFMYEGIPDISHPGPGGDHPEDGAEHPAEPAGTGRERPLSAAPFPPDHGPEERLTDNQRPHPALAPAPVYVSGRVRISFQEETVASGLRNAPLTVNTEQRPSDGAAQELIAMVNGLRRSGTLCGRDRMPPVRELADTRALTRAAQSHAGDMADRGYFSGTSPAGLRAAHRLDAAGYAWATQGELLAKGAQDARQVLDAWRTSEPMCRALMNGAYSEVGAGRAGREEVWVLLLAIPPAP